MDDISFTAKAVGAILLLAFIMGGCLGIASCTKIEPGHVGVSINKCGDGVAKTTIPTGYYFKGPFCEDVVEYPTNLRTLALTDKEGEGHPTLDQALTVTSREGMSIEMDVTLTFTIDPTKVPTIYEKFRADVDKIAVTFIRQSIREGLQMTSAKYTAEELYSDKKEITRAEVEAFLTKKLLVEGFVVQQFTIDRQVPPEQVTAAITAKVVATQQIQQAEAEVRKTQALAAQRKAAATGEAESAELQAAGEAKAMRLRADAEAYYNQTVSKSLTPELVQFETAKKWNGVLPTYTGGGAVPFLPIK